MKRTAEYWEYPVRVIFWVLAALGAYKPRAYELAMIRALARTLRADGPSRVALQLEHFNTWTRHSQDQMVCMSRRKGTVHIPVPDRAKFPLAVSCFTLAGSVRCRVKRRQSEHVLRADVYIRAGELEQITFDRPPVRVFGNRRITEDEIEVLQVQLLIDPMDHEVIPVEVHAGNVDLSSWVRELAEKWGYREIRGPLRERDREALLKFYELQLPSDYVELTSQVEGITIGQCQVLGLSAMVSFVSPAESYYILAYIFSDPVPQAKELGCLALVRDYPPGLYYIDAEDLMPLRVGNSLRDAIEEIMRNGVASWRSA